VVSEPVTASEVAEEVGCTRRAALNKLDELAERGDIESKKVGARSRVWWRPPDLDSSADRSLAHDETVAPETNEAPVSVEGTLSDISKRLDAELEEVFGRISDAFYALDDQWRFTHVSERAEELIDYRGEGLVGKNFWEVFEWATDSKLGEEYRKAMATQETTSFEFYYPEPLEAWYEIHAYPSETGLSVYFQDVTDRKQRERRLEESEHRYRALVEHFPNGAVALVDENLTYRTVGGNPLDVESDWTIQADETYVQHLFWNLFENAVEHGSTSHRTESGDAVEHGATNPRSQAHENAVEHGGANVTIEVGDLPTGFYVADDGPGIGRTGRRLRSGVHDRRRARRHRARTGVRPEVGRRVRLGVRGDRERGWRCAVRVHERRLGRVDSDASRRDSQQQQASEV
jgi:PAS domain S-box-containing protein